MEFKIINKYLQEEGRTFVSIRSAVAIHSLWTRFDRWPYQRIRRGADPSRTWSSRDWIEPGWGVKKLQEDLHTQAQEYEAKLAKKTKKFKKWKTWQNGAYSLA